MKTENERQFLVKKLPDNLCGFEHIFIQQGYLSIADSGSEHRIRREEDDFLSIVKIGAGQKRLESEPVAITGKQFASLWPLTQGRRIWKTRYRIPCGETTIELDIYWRHLQGLIVAEVEFSSDEQAQAFTPPDWFGREVTDDRRYSDQRLSVYGKPAEITFFPLTERPPVLDLDSGVKKLAEVIRLDQEKRSGGSTIVLVGGGSSTGKTAKVVREAAEMLGFREIASAVISADDYNKGKKWKDAEAARGNALTWDDPEIYDYRELFMADLPKLLSDTPIKKRIFSFLTNEPDWARDDRGNIRHIYPAQVIFIEGLHVLSDKWADFGHIRVFADTGMHGRMIRRLMRDVGRTGNEPAKILKFFLRDVEPKHRQFVEPTRVNADLIIGNEYAPELEAGNCGRLRRQMKLRTECTRDLATAAGAVIAADMIYQKDHYFCPHARDIGKTGESIRIRNGDGVKSMTYKGPKRIAGGRDETPVLTAGMDEETETMFRSLYGKETGTIIKFRTWYRLDGIDFSFDAHVVKIVDGRTVLLGNFVEITVPENGSEEALKNMLAKLWLNPADCINKSYIEM